QSRWSREPQRISRQAQSVLREIRPQTRVPRDIRQHHGCGRRIGENARTAAPLTRGHCSDCRSNVGWIPTLHFTLLPFALNFSPKPLSLPPPAGFAWHCPHGIPVCAANSGLAEASRGVATSTADATKAASPSAQSLAYDTFLKR